MSSGVSDDPIGRPAVPDPSPSAAPADDLQSRSPAPGVDSQSRSPVPAVDPRTQSPDVDDDEKPTSALDRQIRTILEWVAVAVGALAVALIIKTFLLQAFYIPSGSMETTLTRGDRVLVNKLSYDVHDVNRGDVIVFGKPPGEGGDIDDLIKRVIGLPGETVTFRDGSIFIDGVGLDEPYLEPDVLNLAKTPIPNCVNTAVADSCTIPADRVFVMGDNREASRDSRFFGPIEENTIVGRAFLKVWPLSDLGFL